MLGDSRFSCRRLCRLKFENLASGKAGGLHEETEHL
jgi:hypothetical protein